MRVSGPGIVVVGSINTDMCVFVDEIPVRGETVLGRRFAQTHGGKGANQAVAAARLGASVTFVGRVGDDVLGRDATEALRREGVCTDCVAVDGEEPSGVALIFIDRNGENTIAVAAGANNALSVDDVARAEDAIAGADYLLLQLEVPLATVCHAARLAGKHGVPVLLNPAPALAGALPRELLSAARVLTPNREELRRLAPRVEDPVEAAAALTKAGPGLVIVTLGAEGVLVCEEAGPARLPAFRVEALDTVGAGDCFSGALAVALAEGRSIREAARLAAAAAAISVGRQGAQASMPTRQEVVEFLNSHESGDSVRC